MSQSDCIDGDLNAHEWKPLSFVFETQRLDGYGGVQVRQPDIRAGRVYAVCMRCFKHTYIVTQWVGFCLDEPDTPTS